MRKLLLIMLTVVAMTVFTIPQAFAAETTKTGVVNFNVVINNSDAGKKANAELNEMINTKRTEAQEKAKNVDSLKKALDEQAASLSAEDKKAKQEELNKAFKDYQSTVAQYNAEVQNKQAELRSQVMQGINEVLTKIAKEENYSFILDASAVPYYDKANDISEEVIQKYNEVNKSK